MKKLPDEEIKMLTSNLDAVYVYLDLYIDSMSDEEVLFWKQILQEIDPDNNNPENIENEI